MILECPCGADLALGKSEGIWTMAEVACEYRTCVGCQSTRAFAPVDVLEGRLVQRYPSKDTSESDGEWDSFLESIEEGPTSPECELRRNGVVLARTYLGIDNVYGWKVEAPCAL